MPFTDGAYVDANAFPSAFPYLNPPLPGSPNSLSVTLTLQSSPSVTGPYANTKVQYNSANSTLSAPLAGQGNGFYRAAADLPGVLLGQPTLTGTNVVIGVQVP